MVDVVRDNRAAAGDLAADELWVAVLAQGDEFHLAGDDAALGVVHLGNAATFPGAQRGALFALPFLGGRAAALGGAAIIGQVALAAGVFFDIVTLGDPLRTQRFQAHLRVALRPARAVDAERLVGAAGRIVQLDFGLRDLQAVVPDRGVGVLGVDFGVVTVGSRHGFQPLFLRWF